MKSKKILHAMSNIDDKFIEEAAPSEQTPTKAKKHLPAWIAAAACLCAAVIGGFMLLRAKPAPIAPQPDISIDEIEGVYIPPAEINLSSGLAADMMGLFIYQGRCYMQYGWFFENPGLVGEKLGTLTGLIDEWTPQSGYVESAGTIAGDFYSVNGFDPSFILCMKFPQDTAGQSEICLYINNNDLTLNKGRELFEDRLHLSENLSSVSFRSYKSWNSGEGDNIPIGSEHDEAVERFIAAMNNGEFVHINDIPTNGFTSVHNTSEWFMYFELNNGVTVQVQFFEGGYVRFTGLYEACVKVDDAAFEEITQIMERLEG